MIVAGCDLGSTTGKAVLLKDKAVLSSSIIPSLTRPEATANQVMDLALEKGGLSSLDDIEYIVGTGYGRLKVAFANENISEITCHGRGAQWLCPSVRTVIDIGGQDCKVISIDERGRVVEFGMNDKCAAGTGRFLEAMSRVLSCSLEDLAIHSLKAKSPASITSQCSVFAESEVITLINEGLELADIAAGIHDSIASRLNGLARRVGLIKDVALTGGCAKNDGLAKAVEKKSGISVKKLSMDAQLVGAIGAAVIAMEKAQKE